MSRTFALVLCFALSEAAFAHEPPTHFDLSVEAVRKSVLGQASTLADLGFSQVIDDENQKFPSTPGDQGDQFELVCSHGASLTILQLIACGSQFEDVPGTRALNHFFDPVNNSPLTINGIKPGDVIGKPNLKSPDWALQDAGSEDAAPTQEFAYRNARDYFHKALTSVQQSDRDTNWGKLFQSIGQVIHHPQDMTQPQHVRNDAHCDSVPCALVNLATLGILGIYNPSKFEKYTSIGLTLTGGTVRERVQQLASAADGNAVYPGPNNANVSVFNTPRKFFFGAGKGIAEYTNANFVSEGTNFTFNNGVVGTHPRYSQPIPGQASTPVPVSELFPNGIPSPVQVGCRLDPTNCSMTFYSTTGTDPLTGLSFKNDRASTLSIFDSDLQAAVQLTDPATGQQYVTQRAFALNRFNFDAAHGFLIPRAVSYSAGLINYFFRGKLDFKRDEQDSSKFRIVNLGPEAMNGRFALYYDAKDGNRYPVAVVDPADPNDPNAWSLTIAKLDPEVPNSNLSDAIAFVPPVIGDSPTSPKVPNQYMLVFKGNMGEERAENGTIGAVVAKSITAPYNGVLYVRVIRSQRGLRTLRVDKSGTRYVVPGEFDPFVGVEVRNGSESPSYTMKQVVFTQSALGEPIHRTIALAAGIYGDLYPKSYAFDGPTGFRVINEKGVTWLAKSGDPQIGDFEIGMLPLQRPFLASGLEYKRTFVQNGQTQTQTGIITLPPQSSFANNQGWDLGGRVLIAGDGLLWTTGLLGLNTSADGNRTTSVEQKYRFVLGTTPTAEIANSAPELYSSFSEERSNVNELLGFFSFTAPGGRCPEMPDPVTSQAENRHTLNRQVRTFTKFDKRVIGYQNGALQIATMSSRGVTNDRDESFGGAGGVGGCPDGGWMFSQTHTESVHMGTADTEVVLPAGKIIAHGVGSSGNAQFPFLIDRTTDLVYEGPAVGAPPPTIVDKDPTVFSGNFLFHPLGPRPEDAFVQVNDGLFLSNIYFRGLDVTSRRFSHDASPLGEIFFATEDKSVVIHEPKAGGMPKIELPNDVLSIISAIWL